MIITNDLHLGAVRRSGVTPTSQEALRNYTFEQLDKLLASTGHQSLVVNGDVLDAFEISPRDWLSTYRRFSAWLAENPVRHLYLIAGNHDDSPMMCAQRLDDSSRAPAGKPCVRMALTVSASRRGVSEP